MNLSFLHSFFHIITSLFFYCQRPKYLMKMTQYGTNMLKDKVIKMKDKEEIKNSDDPIKQSDLV